MKILLILLISLFFRFIYLDVIPVSLAHDEIDNIIQAQSVRHTLSDISGTWHPLSFLPTPTLMGELAPLINVPMLTILPQSIFASRATSALLSSLYPLLLIIFLLSIGVTKKVATVTALLLAVSPWHIIFSRTALEQPTSLFFYTLSWIFLAKVFESRKVALPFFILSYTLGFFTYHGFKFSLPLLTGVIAFYFAWLNHFKYQWSKFIIVILFITSLFVHVLLNQSVYMSRSVELIFQDTTRYAQDVDNERRISLAPDILKPIFSNKYLSLAEAVRDKYLYAISPDLLFKYGENNGMFALWTMGYFYLFTLPFIFIGLASILYTRSKEQLLILVLSLLSPLSSIIHTNDSYAFRSAIYFVLLNIILAYGCVEAYSFICHSLPKFKTYIFGAIALLAISSLIHFSYLYFYVSPVNNSSAYFFGERLMAQYISLSTSEKNKILVIDSQPRYAYSSHILSRSRVGSEDIASFNHRYSFDENDQYSALNLTFIRDCPDSIEEYDTVIIGSLGLKDTTRCSALRERMSLSSTHTSSLVILTNNGVERFIIGDKLCAGLPLNTFVHPTSLSDFRLSQLSREEFCTTWVVKQ